MIDFRTVITAVLLALGTSVVPASADGPYPASADGPHRDRYAPCCIDQEYHWGGVFVGGHIAGAISQADWSATAPTEGFHHNDTSFGGGVQAAVQRQWDRVVAGVEVSFTWIDFEATKPSLVTLGETASSTVSDLLIVAAKLGYAQDRWLAFAKAGYASADFSIRSTTAAGVTTASTDREHGWVMGIGIDYAVTRRISLGVEYDWSFFSPEPRNLAGRRFSGDDDIQRIAARLMFKFGAD